MRPPASGQEPLPAAQPLGSGLAAAGPQALLLIIGLRTQALPSAAGGETLSSPRFQGEAHRCGLPPSSPACPGTLALTALSVPREGYNNPPISGENVIGLSRARRPHNAIFVNFEDDGVPAQPLEAAVQTWKKVCTNPLDQKVEKELRKVRTPPGPPLHGRLLFTPLRPIPAALWPALLAFLDAHSSTRELFSSRRRLKATPV